MCFATGEGPGASRLRTGHVQQRGRSHRRLRVQHGGRDGRRPREDDARPYQGGPKSDDHRRGGSLVVDDLQGTPPHLISTGFARLPVVSVGRVHTCPLFVSLSLSATGDRRIARVVELAHVLILFRRMVHLQYPVVVVSADHLTLPTGSRCV